MLHKALTQMSRSLLHRQGAAADLVVAGAFTPEQYLQLHRNNIFISLTEALADIYPVVARLVGDDFFTAACREFIPQYPPRAAPMLEFGSEFPEFLVSYSPAESLGYLADVARLEWAWHESFHAADAPAFDLSSIGTVDAAGHGNLRFVLHPAARLLRSDYPVYRIWETNQDNFSGDGRVDLDVGADHLLIKRLELEVLVQPIEVAEWHFLQAFANGENLDTAYDAACSVGTGFDLEAALINRVSDRTLVNAIQ